MSRFGELLRYYRHQCWDAEHAKPLTQGRLGELLGRALGDLGYSGAAVSEWERGKSRISHDQRKVLVSLIKVLHECGGLQTLTEADTLLLAGDYRPLNADERQYLSPAWANGRVVGDPPPKPKGYWQMVTMFLSDWFGRRAEAFTALKSSRNGGPSPGWTGVLLEMMGQPLRGWSSARVLRAIAWVVVWLLGWGLTFPALHWPFENREQAWLAAVAYMTGAMIVPVLVGGLTRTRGDEFWRRQPSAKTFALRLFTHQGAFIGFHVGYMLVFTGALSGYYLVLGAFPRWLEGIAAVWPILLGYASARQVPFNLWRAYGRLRFTGADLGPTLAFILFGPGWAIFFHAYYPWLLYSPTGLALILSALGIAAGSAAWQERAHKTRKQASPDGGQ